MNILRRTFLGGCLAALAAAAFVPSLAATGRDGVRIYGQIHEVRCGEDRQVALCVVGDQRVLVNLTGASIFVNGEPARCGALQPGRRFAAFGRFTSRDPLSFDACIFVSRSETDRVTTVCGHVLRISAADGMVLIGDRTHERRVLVRVDDFTRVVVNGEPGSLRQVMVGDAACASGMLHRADPYPIMRPTRRLEVKQGGDRR